MSLLLARSWESLAMLVSLARDVNLGKPLPHSMEPRERFYAYTRRVG
jgi:hypothetical protein